MTRMHLHKSRKRRAGFTLVEMMVALTAGSLAITSIYMVSAASSQHFQEQQQVSQTQASLRMAVERLREDIERAGFLAPLNTFNDQEVTRNCQSVDFSGVPIGAIRVEQNNVAQTALLTQAVTNKVFADQIDLVGNYVSADEYRGIMTAGNKVQIYIGNQAFRRSFGTSADPNVFGDAFCGAFADGRGLRITDQNGSTSVHRIIDTVAAAVDGCDELTQTITFDPPVAQLASGHESCSPIGYRVYVAPLSHIRYSVREFANAATDKFRGGDILTGINGPSLVRSEITWKGATFNPAETVVPADRLIGGTAQQSILEYVADFHVDILQDTRTGPGSPTPMAEATAADDMVSTVTGTGQPGPHRFRAARLRLSVRSPTEDPRFQFVARASAAEHLLRYELDPTMYGAARVRTVSTEVLLPNFAHKGRH